MAVVEAFKVNALEAIKFKFLYPGDNIENIEENDNHSFSPTLAHQIFGEEQVILGYKNLKIWIVYHHNSLECLLIYKGSKAPHQKLIKCDNIEEVLAPFLPNKIHKDCSDFVKHTLHEDSKKTYGTLKHCFYNNHCENKRLNYFEVRQCDLSDPDFKEFHRRYESLIFWYIDAASRIDLNDPMWEIIYLYTVSESSVVTPVGYCSYYKFFAYPDQIRIRISQFFILPPYQRQGLGKKFLTCIYKILWAVPKLHDIVVESPSPTFTEMKATVDTRLALELPFVNWKTMALDYNSSIEHKLMATLKLSKQQCHVVYDIVKYLMLLKYKPSKVKTFIYDIKYRMLRDYKRKQKRLRNSTKNPIRIRKTSIIAERVNRIHKQYLKNQLIVAHKIHKNLEEYFIHDA